MMKDFYSNYKEVDLLKVQSDVSLPMKKMDLMIGKYQDPREVDKLMKLQS